MDSVTATADFDLGGEHVGVPRGILVVAGKGRAGNRSKLRRAA